MILQKKEEIHDVLHRLQTTRQELTIDEDERQTS